MKPKSYTSLLIIILNNLYTGATIMNFSVLSLLLLLISIVSTSCSNLDVSNERSQHVQVKKDAFGISSDREREYKVTVFCHQEGANSKVSMLPKNITKSDLTIRALRNEVSEAIGNLTGDSCNLLDISLGTGPINGGWNLHTASSSKRSFSVEIKQSNPDAILELPAGFMAQDRVHNALQTTSCDGKDHSRAINLIYNTVLDFNKFRSLLAVNCETEAATFSDITITSTRFQSRDEEYIPAAERRMTITVPSEFIEDQSQPEKKLDLTKINETLENLRVWYNMETDDLFEQKKRRSLENYDNNDAMFYRFTRYHHWVAGVSAPECGGNNTGVENHEFCVLGEIPAIPGVASEFPENFGAEDTLLSLATLDQAILSNPHEVKYDRKIDCSSNNLSDDDSSYCSDKGYLFCSSSILCTIKKEESFYVSTVEFEGRTYVANPCNLSLDSFVKNGENPGFKCNLDTDFEKYAAQHLASNTLTKPEKLVLGLEKAGEFFGTLAAFILAPELTIALMSAYIVEQGVVNHESALKIAGELALAIGSLYPPIMVTEMLVGLAINIDRAVTADCSNAGADFNDSCAGIYEDVGLNLAMMAFMGREMYKSQNAESITKQHIQDIASKEEVKPLLSGHEEELDLEECKGTALTGGLALTCQISPINSENSVDSLLSKVNSEYGVDDDDFTFESDGSLKISYENSDLNSEYVSKVYFSADGAKINEMLIKEAFKGNATSSGNRVWLSQLWEVSTRDFDDIDPVLSESIAPLRSSLNEQNPIAIPSKVRQKDVVNVRSMEILGDKFLEPFIEDDDMDLARFGKNVKMARWEVHKEHLVEGLKNLGFVELPNGKWSKYYERSSENDLVDSLIKERGTNGNATDNFIQKTNQINNNKKNIVGMSLELELKKDGDEDFDEWISMYTDFVFHVN